jgi:hypothetical protein
MKRTSTGANAIAAPVVVSAITLAAAAMTLAAAGPDPDQPFHERKEVAGLAVVFGAEPEPALTDEIQFLRWRVSTLADEEPYGDFTNASVTIIRDGERLGPFALSPVRGTPGQYQTRHIFTEAGEYGSVLSFSKGEDAQVHTVDFDFNITDRAELEIPRRRGGR